MLRQQWFSVALVSMLSACLWGDNGEDTDIYAARAPTKLYPTSHIAADLVGVWKVRVPEQLRRKKQVIGAGLEGLDPASLTPPLRDVEREWYDRAGDKDAPYLEWYRCATTCRFTLSESGIWNVGYSGFLDIGSSLVEPTINGRTVTYEMMAHDPGGFRGLVILRMNKDFTSFRVKEFRVKDYRDPQMPQKLELYFDKVVQ